MTDKLAGEMFWVDRWTGSSAFGLPIEARGVYREMLSQAWWRGARLPNDHETIQRIIGATPREWNRNWSLISPFWRVDGDYLVNDTQLEIYTETQARLERAASRGKAGAQARAQAKLKQGVSNNSSNAQAMPERKPLDLDLDSKQRTLTTRAAEPLTARSNHPAFRGSRIVVFDWMLADLMAMLGAHADDFDWHAWFYELDAKAARETRVITTRDERWKWIQEKTAEEASRRGLRGTDGYDSYRDGQHAWSCGTCGEVHQGTLKQRGKCLKATQEGVSQ